MDGACRLLCKLSLTSRTKAFTRFINVKGIRAILAHLTWVVHRLSNHVLTRHHRLLVCQLRIISSAQIIRATNILHHEFIHFNLLESTLASCAKSFTNTRGHTHRFKRTLTTTIARIINASLEIVRGVLHSVNIAKGDLGIIEHLFHFLLTNHRAIITCVRGELCRVGFRSNILLHRSAEERLHIIVRKVLRVNGASRERTDNLPTFNVRGGFFNSSRIHHDIRCSTENASRGGGEGTYLLCFRRCKTYRSAGQVSKFCCAIGL